MPPPRFIKKLCDMYKLSLGYFDNYYFWYFNNPEEVFINWKEDNKYSYQDYQYLLNIHRSCIRKFAIGQIPLTYNIYVKLHKVKVL